ncbi:NACHT domain-containing protein [Streptomyces triculaminicus]|uniref:NACHT domain-containing protein n=1 Tax=Streptomyces triculaminicus TaxID=2816232 RepID=UPI0037880779
MAGGRPSTNGSKAQPELQELAGWFREALRASGHETANAFLTARHPARRVPPPHRNAVYEILGARRLHKLATNEQFAQALGVPQGDVVEVWGRARRALERREMVARRAAPGPARATWPDIPVPDAWLQDLLSGQADAAEQFPYDLLGVHKPPLSHIYVEQDVQPLSEKADGHVSRAARPVPTLAAALSAHDHLFITGGPGAGKTTLGRHLVRQISRYWLREEGAEDPWCWEAVVALRVTATDLRTRRAFHQQLSDAADRTGTLRSAVPADRFVTRPHGVRWLVVVDGLDEVVSPGDRKLILQNLAREIRPHGVFRLLITSRPLPQGELQPFRDLPSIGFYTLKGFDPAQQLAFAKRWFAAQGAPDPAAESRSFLEEVGHAGLGEVLQVPLLTTIAAAFRSRNPRALLPRGRVALYEQFLADVATAREGADEVDKGFQARWERRGQGRLAEWLLTHRDRLITHLAQVRTTSGEASALLLDAALTWLATVLPADLAWPEGARDELGQFLAQGGALVYDHGEVSFLHLSFAEFLAARDEAAQIPADFPGLDDWADEIRSPSSRNRVLFTFALWARRPGHDVTVVVRHLLAGDLDHRIMALRLITSGVRLGEALEDAVIDRVVDLGQHSDYRDRGRGNQVLRELSQLRGNRRLAATLRRIAETDGLCSSLRIGAASAYAQAASLSEGIALLKEMAQAVSAEGILKCCRELAALDPADTGFRARLLSDLLATSTADNWTRLTAAEELAALGRTEGLADFACSLLADAEENGGALVRAGQLWYELEGPSAAPRVAAAVAGRSRARDWAKAALAQVLLLFGLVDEALPLVAYTIENSVDSDAIGDVVQGWLDQQGEKAADALVDLMGEYKVWNTDARPSIAIDLVQAGFPQQAVELVRLSLNDPDPDTRHYLELEMKVLIRALGRHAAQEVLNWVDRHGATAHSYASAMQDLAEAGAHAESLLPLARRLLHHPGSGNDEFTSAARTLFQLAPADACAEVLAALHDRPYGGPALRAALLPLLAECGEAAAVRALGQELLADPGLVGHELEAVIAAWLTLEGREAVANILDRVRASVPLMADQSMAIARFLAAEGLARAAVPLWCQVTAGAGTGVEIRWRAAQELLAVGAAQQAEHALRTALATARDLDEALLLGRLLAWVQPPTPPMTVPPTEAGPYPR